MGEYAIYQGEEIKIGTCEDMLYLRASQASLVTPMSGSLNPADPSVHPHIRFRFPWPDEDGTAPGHYERADRTAGLFVDVPADIEHHSRQFTAPGYVTSLPCPESPAWPSDLRFFRNGNPGTVRISQQRWWEGMLVTVLQCGGCGSAFRLPTLADAAPYIAACRAEADSPYRRDDTHHRSWWNGVADRIELGYTNPAEMP